MTEFIAAISPGMEHVFRQRDLEKTLVVEARKGAKGPRPLDLESGVVEIEVPAQPETDELTAPGS